MRITSKVIPFHWRRRAFSCPQAFCIMLMVSEAMTTSTRNMLVALWFSPYVQKSFSCPKRPGSSHWPGFFSKRVHPVSLFGCLFSSMPLKRKRVKVFSLRIRSLLPLLRPPIPLSVAGAHFSRHTPWCIFKRQNPLPIRHTIPIEFIGPADILGRCQEIKQRFIPSN